MSKAVVVKVPQVALSAFGTKRGIVLNAHEEGKALYRIEIEAQRNPNANPVITRTMNFIIALEKFPESPVAARLEEFYIRYHLTLWRLAHLKRHKGVEHQQFIIALRAMLEARNKFNQEDWEDVVEVKK